MPLSAAAAGAIGAGAQLVGTATQVGTGLFGKKKSYEYNSKLQAQQAEYNRQAQERAFEQNRALSEYAYDRELQQWERENAETWKMWNAQNDYNTPSSQMARYQEAGLNPGLIYGQSNEAGSMSAASSPSYGASPMQAEQMSGSSGVGDQLAMNLTDPIQEYYRVQNMQQQLNNAKAQEEVLLTQAQKNRMDAIFGEANTNYLGIKSDMLNAGRPYWALNAEFDSVAKKFQNDMLGANIAAQLYKNQNILPKEAQRLGLLNDLASQNLSFHAQMNPLLLSEKSQAIKHLFEQTEYTNKLRQNAGLDYELKSLDIDMQKVVKDFILGNKDVDDSMFRQLLIRLLGNLKIR